MTLHVDRDYPRIRIKDSDEGGYIGSTSVESNLLYMILEKLEEIKKALEKNNGEK